MNLSFTLKFHVLYEHGPDILLLMSSFCDMGEDTIKMLGLKVLQATKSKKKIKPSMNILLLVLILITLLLKVMKLLNESGKIQTINQS